jgi:hypothetical protein
MTYPSLKEIATTFKTLFDIQSVVGFPKVRIGSEYDGGYIMVDDFVGVDFGISAGIGNNDDWEREIARKFPIVAYDPIDDNIPNMPYEFRNERLSCLNPLLENYSNNTLIGKIDIEGDEFEVFNNTDLELLSKFRQLVCELHIEHVMLTQEKINAIKKLTTVFNTVHIHGHNASKVFKFNNMIIPEIFEITLVNKSYYTFEPFTGSLPCELDRPIVPSLPELKFM